MNSKKTNHEKLNLDQKTRDSGKEPCHRRTYGTNKVNLCETKPLCKTVKTIFAEQRKELDHLGTKYELKKRDNAIVRINRLLFDASPRKDQVLHLYLINDCRKTFSKFGEKVSFKLGKFECR